MDPWAKQEMLETRRSNAVSREFIRSVWGSGGLRHGVV
jgi:hypothetical protein